MPRGLLLRCLCSAGAGRVLCLPVQRRQCLLCRCWQQQQWQQRRCVPAAIHTPPRDAALQRHCGCPRGGPAWLTGRLPGTALCSRIRQRHWQHWQRSGALSAATCRARRASNGGSLLSSVRPLRCLAQPPALQCLCILRPGWRQRICALRAAGHGGCAGRGCRACLQRALAAWQRRGCHSVHGGPAVERARAGVRRTSRCCLRAHCSIHHWQQHWGGAAGGAGSARRRQCSAAGALGHWRGVVAQCLLKQSGPRVRSAHCLS